MQRISLTAGTLRTVNRTPLIGRVSPLHQSLSKAPYHSYEHEQTPPFSPVEDAILSAAITHVPTQGFSTNALAQGAQDAGYRDVSINLFPKGPFTLVQYHLTTQRLALAKSFEKQGENVDNNIRDIAWQRLQANKAVITRWQEVCSGAPVQKPSLRTDQFRLRRSWPCPPTSSLAYES